MYSEIDEKISKQKASLLEFCIESLVVFGYFSSKLAIIYPFKFARKVLLSGGIIGGRLTRGVSYWTPFLLTEEEFMSLVKELQNPDLRNNLTLKQNPNIHIPYKIIFDAELNSNFNNEEDWYKGLLRKHIKPKEFGQFSLGFTYKVFFDGQVIGNFICNESRRHSKFKGYFSPTNSFSFHSLKSAKHAEGERFEPKALDNYYIEDNYSVKRNFKFIYFKKYRKILRTQYRVFFQIEYP